MKKENNIILCGIAIAVLASAGFAMSQGTISSADDNYVTPKHVIEEPKEDLELEEDTTEDAEEEKDDDMDNDDSDVEESKKEETAKKTEASAKEKKESPLAAKTVKELKAYAEEKGIALDSRAKKADIIATIEAAERK